MDTAVDDPNDQVSDRARDRARGDLNAKLAALERKIEDKNIVLSRWSFEQLLDGLTVALSAFVGCSLKKNIGCALVYRTQPEHCYVGGASKDRRKMGFNSRYYNLLNDWSTSLTAFAMKEKVCILLDHFKNDCVVLESLGLSHVPKNCETKSNETGSYYSYPVAKEPGDQRIVGKVRGKDDLRKLQEGRPHLRRTMIGASEAESERKASDQTESLGTAAMDSQRLEDAQYAVALLRFTSTGENDANRIEAVLDQLESGFEEGAFSLRDRLCNLLRKGVERVGGSNVPSVEFKSLADLFKALPDWRGSESFALDQLTIFLQAMFESCEVSIFEAHTEGASEGFDEVSLQLAATTALSEGGQHGKFRNAFYRQNKKYACWFVRGTNTPREGRDDVNLGKTALAYYRSPVLANFKDADMKSKRHRGLGEIEADQVGSFLAFAIPSTLQCERPYGVVRIVSGKDRDFDVSRRELAEAVAGGLRLLWETFPKREDLIIDIDDEIRKGPLERFLGDNELEREFGWLLQKVFWDLASIRFERVTAVLDRKELRADVKADGGALFELTCTCKDRTHRYAQQDESGRRETRNLMAVRRLMPAKTKAFDITMRPV